MPVLSPVSVNVTRMLSVPLFRRTLTTSLALEVQIVVVVAHFREERARIGHEFASENRERRGIEQGDGGFGGLALRELDEPVAVVEGAAVLASRGGVGADARSTEDRDVDIVATHAHLHWMFRAQSLVVGSWIAALAISASVRRVPFTQMSVITPLAAGVSLS